MISKMSEAVFDTGITIRTVSAAKRALDRATADLRASGRIRFKGQKVTKEAVINAMWLAIADVDPDRLERWLAPYVVKLEEEMRKGSTPVVEDDDPFPGPPAGNTPVSPHDGGRTLVEQDLSAETERRIQESMRKRRTSQRQESNKPPNADGSMQDGKKAPRKR